MNLPELKIGHLTPRIPIIQGGMAVRLSTAKLAAAVAEEGGIGLIAASGMSPDELRQEIRLARSLTKGIIGINIMFAISDFQELSIAALEEGIDIFVSGAGFSRDMFAWGKKYNTPIVPIVSSAKLAKLSQKLGAAAVIAEGKEAGGHLGTEESMRKIVPEIKVAVDIPVIAAGGIVDAQDMAEAFQLGANGVQLGIRFAASEEANGAENLKEYYVQASRDDIRLINSPVGLPGRAIRNVFTDRLEAGLVLGPENCIACLKECAQNFCIMEALNNAQQGNLDEGLIFSGEYIEKITKIMSVKEIVSSLLEEVKNI